MQCLAEPISRVCKVGLSNFALLIVLVCVIVKTAQCIVVWQLLGKENLLVTLSDAVAYFIARPDACTGGLCTYSASDMKTLALSKDLDTLARSTRPRAWVNRSPHWWNTVSIKTQVLTYCLLAIVVGFAGYLYHQARSYATGTATFPDRILYQEAFGPNAINDVVGKTWLPQGRILVSALLANLPQLVLSLCYFFYNALLTRMLMAREWALLSMDYRPLRVTDPEGEQISSYRLQIPYLYGIPLLALSAILHWLLSNSVYGFIGEGGKCCPIICMYGI
jgi:hypothetical protein